MEARKPWPMAILAAAAMLLGCKPSPPDIPFAKYGDDYQTKMDFAKIEYTTPLRRADRDKITPENLRALSQEEIDQIYARLTAGPIPDGPYEGGVHFARGTGLDRLAEVVGGLKGVVLEIKARHLQRLARMLWKGKVFYRDQRLLRNRIEDTVLLAPLIDGKLGEIPKISANGKEAWLLFPAKLYCGQSLLDSRRESIIIDYAFADDIEGYREKPDFLAGRRGLQVRDEIRMIRPGFYLGRAYLSRVFVLNFTLYNEAVADRGSAAFDHDDPIAEDCWTGTQAVAALVR
jgi:hypothetical protein